MDPYSQNNKYILWQQLLLCVCLDWGIDFYFIFIWFTFLVGGEGRLNNISYFPQLFSFRCFIVFWRLRITFYRLSFYWLIYLTINALTPWRTVLLEKLTVTQLSRNSPHFMETKGSLPHSQMLTNCAYPNLDRFSPCPHLFHFLYFYINIILPCMPGFSKWSFFLRFPHQKPVSTSPLPHKLLHIHIIFLYLITWIILFEYYKSLTSSLCSFLHSPVTSSL